MATKLDKIITRETSVVYQTRPLLISLQPRSFVTLIADDMIEFRLKGRRDHVRLKIFDAFQYALRRAQAQGGKDG